MGVELCACVWDTGSNSCTNDRGNGIENIKNRGRIIFGVV
jgi:hypothetical protein